MNISMDKKYTLNGLPFTVLTVTKPGANAVVGYDYRGSTYYFNVDGSNNYFIHLVEVSPYADFVIDEKVMVRYDDWGNWERRIFLGVDKVTGLPRVSLFTEWVQEGRKSSVWNQCRRPTAEELAT